MCTDPETGSMASMIADQLSDTSDFIRKVLMAWPSDYTEWAERLESICTEMDALREELDRRSLYQRSIVML